MSPFRFARSFIISLAFALGRPAFADPVDQKTSPERPAHVDRYGDPLPAGVIARLGTLRFRHSSGANSVAFSRDGKIVASAAAWSASLWDTATGQELSRFKGKIQAGVVAFSADGKTLMAARPNGIIQHFDVATGDLLRQVGSNLMEADPDHFNGHVAEISSNARILALTDYGSNGRLLDLATGKVLLRIHQDRGLASIDVSHDGKTVATGGQDNTARIWAVDSGKELLQMKGHNNWVYCVRFSPDDKMVATAAGDDLRIYEVGTGKQILEIPGGGGRLAFSPDGKIIASGRDNRIALWEVGSGKQIRHWEGHESCLAFSSDGKFLAAGSSDLLIWDVATGKPSRDFQGHRAAVFCLAYSNTGTLASGDLDGTLIIWDLATRKPKHFCQHPGECVQCLAYSPDGKTVITGGGSGGTDDREAQIRFWDVGDGSVKKQFFGHLNCVQSLAFSPDGKTLASSGWDARCRMWDAQTAKKLYQIRGPDAPRTVAFSPDGKALLVAYKYNGGMALYRADTGDKLRDLSPPSEEIRGFPYAAFLPDRKSIAALTQNYTMVQDIPRARPRREAGLEYRTYDTATGKRIRSFSMIDARGTRHHSLSSMACFALSPDGKTLAAIMDLSAQGEITLWDTDSGKPLISLTGHLGYVTALAFSPDGKTLASGSWDTTVLLWDVRRARLLGQWFRLGGDRIEAAQAVKSLAADPEGVVPFLQRRLRQASLLEAPYAGLVAELDSDRFQTREEASRRLEEIGPAADFALRLALESNASAEVRKRARGLLDKMAAPLEKQINGLLPDLNGENAGVAVQKLQQLGPAAEPVLQRILRQPRVPGNQDVPNSPRVRYFVQQVADKLRKPDTASVTILPQHVLRALSVLEMSDTPEARQALEELAQGPPKSTITRQAKAALDRLPRLGKKP
jgi:WD40 repeat protein